MSNWQWIRFEAHHGGGHQGHTITYKPYRTEDWGTFEDDDVQAILEDWCHDNFRNVHAVAEIVQLRDIPIEDVAKIARTAFSRITYYQNLLEELNEYPRVS